MTFLEGVDVKLRSTYNPTHLVVSDQSALHKGHLDDGPDGESHLHITLVSEHFANMGRLARHQHVYATLKDEMSRLHAIQLNLATPDEWAQK